MGYTVCPALCLARFCNYQIPSLSTFVPCHTPSFFLMMFSLFSTKQFWGFTSTPCYGQCLAELYLEADIQLNGKVGQTSTSKKFSNKDFPRGREVFIQPIAVSPKQLSIALFLFKDSSFLLILAFNYYFFLFLNPLGYDLRYVSSQSLKKQKSHNF